MKINSSLTPFVSFVWGYIWRGWSIAKRVETKADGNPHYFDGVSGKSANDEAIHAWRAA